MKRIAQSHQTASALIVVLFVLLLIVAFIGIATSLTMTTTRETDSSRDFTALRASAEGALDFAYGVWAKTINSYYKPVSRAQLAAKMAKVPSFPGFSYASSAENGPLQITPVDEYGQPMSGPSATPRPTKVNLDNYPGWVGYNSAYIASVRLLGTFIGGRAVTYGVKRAMNYSVVPLFQATAFFEDDLELYHTAPMTIGGLVHTNGKAFVSSSVKPGTGAPSLTFTGNLSYAGGYVDGKWIDPDKQVRDAPPEAWNWSGYSPNTSYSPGYSAGGKEDQLAQVDRMEPLGTDASTLLDPHDDNPNNDSMRELIEPPDAAHPDSTPIAERRLYNKAGIVIHVTTSKGWHGHVTMTATVTTQNGTSLEKGQTDNLKSALSQQTIYDRREGKYVDLATLDVSKAQSAFDSAKNFNGVVYIDDTAADGNISNSDPKGIRLVNGDKLPTDGLTVATQNPLYIQGDYNTKGAQVSSAVFADAVTILSNNWNDNRSAYPLGYRAATDTTVNTAIVAGFLPSGWTNPDTHVQYGYSGGLNNFPRFLENWSGDTFTYNGSMIALFTSKVATGEWDTGNIYAPPNRVWDFDSNFVDNPPPGSLDAVAIARGALARF